MNKTNQGDSHCKESIFAQAAEVYSQSPDTLIIGSIAKAAYMGTALDSLQPDGSARDVDAFRVGEHRPAIEISGVDLDLEFENWINFDGDTAHLVFPYDSSLTVEVPESGEVFAKRMMEYHGREFAAPDPFVLHAISRMQYIERPKDSASHDLFERYLGESEGGRIHPELLEPFDEFRNALSQRSGYIFRGRLRNIYQKAVPSAEVRSKLNLGAATSWLRGR